MDGLADRGHEHEFELGVEFEAAYTTAFWFRFVRTVERRLRRAGICSNGCADGDLPLPACEYASLRNEAYIQWPPRPAAAPVAAAAAAVAVEASAGNDVDADIALHRRLVYPPNAAGWNAARHAHIFLPVIECLEVLASELADRAPRHPPQ